MPRPHASFPFLHTTTTNTSTNPSQQPNPPLFTTDLPNTHDAATTITPIPIPIGTNLLSPTHLRHPSRSPHKTHRPSPPTSPTSLTSFSSDLEISISDRPAPAHPARTAPAPPAQMRPTRRTRPVDPAASASPTQQHGTAQLPPQRRPRPGTGMSGASSSTASTLIGGAGRGRRGQGRGGDQEGGMERAEGVGRMGMRRAGTEEILVAGQGMMGYEEEDQVGRRSRAGTEGRDIGREELGDKKEDDEDVVFRRGTEGLGLGIGGSAGKVGKRGGRKGAFVVEVPDLIPPGMEEEEDDEEVRAKEAREVDRRLAKVCREYWAGGRGSAARGARGRRAGTWDEEEVERVGEEIMARLRETTEEKIDGERWRFEGGEMGLEGMA